MVINLKSNVWTWVAAIVAPHVEGAAAADGAWGWPNFTLVISQLAWVAASEAGGSHESSEAVNTRQTGRFWCFIASAAFCPKPCCIAKSVLFV